VGLGIHRRFGPIAYLPRDPFRTNDADQVRAAVSADLGLAHTPAVYFAPEIALGTVRPVLTDYEPANLRSALSGPAAVS
jgi:DNA-binding transcriptional LysR family regulator